MGILITLLVSSVSNIISWICLFFVPWNWPQFSADLNKFGMKHTSVLRMAMGVAFYL